jgi:RNA polymerase sigma-70 factor (ECF subfamily)
LTEESTLVERARNGDLNAFRHVVDRYKGIVLGVVHDMADDRHDIEDLMQEVFLKVYRSLPAFRGEAKVSTWIYRIALNTCYDHVTKRSYRSMKPAENLDVPSRHAPMFHGNARTNPERAASAGMMQEHIDRAIRTLSPRERSVFVLRHYQDLSLKEIASVLRISEGTVKSMLSRALHRLQKELSFYKKELGMEDAR